MAVSSLHASETMGGRSPLKTRFDKTCLDFIKISLRTKDSQISTAVSLSCFKTCKKRLVHKQYPQKEKIYVYKDVTRHVASKITRWGEKDHVRIQHSGRTSRMDIDSMVSEQVLNKCWTDTASVRLYSRLVGKDGQEFCLLRGNFSKKFCPESSRSKM